MFAHRFRRADLRVVAERCKIETMAHPTRFERVAIGSEGNASDVGVYSEESSTAPTGPHGCQTPGTLMGTLESRHF